jgi:hypothetical protein
MARDVALAGDDHDPVGGMRGARRSTVSLDERARRADGQELLGPGAARERPEAGAGAAGHDHGVGGRHGASPTGTLSPPEATQA